MTHAAEISFQNGLLMELHYFIGWAIIALLVSWIIKFLQCRWVIFNFFDSPSFTSLGFQNLLALNP
jgi:hypothetical protein